MSEKAKLHLVDEDFQALGKCKAVEFGAQKVTIRSATIEDLSMLCEKLKGKFLSFLDLVQQKNEESDTGYIEAIYELLAGSPEILSELTLIDESSIRKLPASKVFELVEAVLEVNEESLLVLSKNLVAWMEKVLAVVQYNSPKS